MSIDCSSLAEMATKGNFGNYTNKNNEILDTIWLNEDFTAPFNKRYWSSSEFLIVFLIYIICLLFIPIIFYFYFYPKFDQHKRLTFYLERNKTKPLILRVHIRELFQIHTNLSDNIIDIILDFGEFHLNHKNMKEYLDSYCESSLNNKRKLGGYSLSIWLMITISYFAMFHVTIHCVDSYRSYVEIPCIPAIIHDLTGHDLRGNCQDDNNHYKDEMGKQCVFEFNFQEICMSDTINLSNYMIYGDLKREVNSAEYTYTLSDRGCKMHKEYFKYRQPIDEWCGCCNDCGRCNDCCNFHAWWGGCDTNGCIYCFCLCFIILPLLIGVFMFIRINSWFNPYEFGYQIRCLNKY